MDADRTRWDARHAERPPATPQAAEILRECPALLDVLASTGRALDVACGTGAVSLWLAERGLDVIAIDVSPVAIGLLRDAADAAGLGSRIDARVHDTDDGVPADAVDLAVIVCQRFRDVRLYVPLLDRLAPEGVLLLSVLSSVGRTGPAGEFHAAEGELTAAFAGHEILHHAEADGLASIAVRRRRGLS